MKDRHDTLRAGNDYDLTHPNDNYQFNDQSDNIAQPISPRIFEGPVRHVTSGSAGRTRCCAAPRVWFVICPTMHMRANVKCLPTWGCA